MIDFLKNIGMIISFLILGFIFLLIHFKVIAKEEIRWYPESDNLWEQHPSSWHDTDRHILVR